MKRFKILIATLLVVATAVAGLATWWLFQSSQVSINAQTRPTPVKKMRKRPAKAKSVHLVALGDSLTQGVGDQRKQGGYVGQIKQQLIKKDHLTVTTSNYGKAGDRSDQIQARLTASSAMQKKLKAADAIVMTVGGNDLMQGFQAATADGSTSIAKMNTAVANTQRTYAAKLTSLLTQVRSLNPTAPIFLFSIYNPVYVYFANVPQLNIYINEFNQTTRAVGKPFARLYFMDINQRLSYGQFDTVAKRAALASKDAQVNKNGVDGQTIEKSLMTNPDGELNKYLSPADHFHPNYSGYTQMTNVLYKTMQQHRQWRP